MNLLLLVCMLVMCLNGARENEICARGMTCYLITMTKGLFSKHTICFIIIISTVLPLLYALYRPVFIQISWIYDL